jgi:hypothetical protein
MVHSTFGSNRPIVLSFLIAPAVAIVVASLYSNTVGEYGLGGPATDLLIAYFGDLNVWRRSLGMLLILSIAVLLNFMSNKHDFSTSENYFPALVFLGFVSLDFENIDLHPVLLSGLFLLLALRRLLSVYRVESALSIGFDSALFLSIAIFFFPPSVILLPLPWMVFLQVRPFNLREWLVPFTAIGLSALYIFSFYFITEYNFSAGEYIVFSGGFFSFEEMKNQPFFFLLIAFHFILSIIGLVFFFSDIAKSTLRKKSTKYIFLWTFFLLVLEYFYVSLVEVRQEGSWLIFSIPVAIFMGVLFSRRGKRPVIRLILFYAWLIAVVAFMVFGN